MGTLGAVQKQLKSQQLVCGAAPTHCSFGATKETCGTQGEALGAARVKNCTTVGHPGACVLCSALFQGVKALEQLV